MADAYMGEIKLAAFNFAPVSWALAAGQVIPLSQNTALFSLLGTTYGGNGTSNFQLPDLQGRTPLGYGGQAVAGEIDGTEQVTLTLSEYPLHNHAFRVNTTGGLGAPTGNFLASVGTPPAPSTGHIYAVGGTPQPLNPASLAAAVGNNLPHDNMQPFLVMNYIIALQGTYPARN